MAINIKRQGISYAIGGVDEVAEWYDRNHKNSAGAPAPLNKAFQNAHDISRVVINLGGLALQQFGPAKYADLGETLALSSGPLVVKSVSAAIRYRSNPQPIANMGYRARTTATPAAPTYAPRENVGRTYEPEFAGTGVL